MRIVSGALAAVVLSGLGWSMPAQAQGLPHGSYQASCTDARMEGDTLVARCRAVDGREERSALADVRRCVGDVGNNNGSLQCNMGGRAAVAPREGYGSEQADRCGGLHRESEELRARLDREVNPLERTRLEGQLRGIHEQEEHCR
jgi:hypothetical protein